MAPVAMLWYVLFLYANSCRYMPTTCHPCIPTPAGTCPQHATPVLPLPHTDPTIHFILSPLPTLAASTLGSDLGLQPADISACNLWVCNAMALLGGEVDTNVIHLLGCWQSNILMEYLHLWAQPHAWLLPHYAP